MCYFLTQYVFCMYGYTDELVCNCSGFLINLVVVVDDVVLFLCV